MLSVVGDTDAEAETYRRFANDGRVDGILVTDARLDDRRSGLVAELGLEAVVVGLKGAKTLMGPDRGLCASPERIAPWPCRSSTSRSCRC